MSFSGPSGIGGKLTFIEFLAIFSYLRSNYINLFLTQETVEKVRELHESSVRSKRTNELDMEKAEEEAIKRDQLINVKQLQSGFSQLKANESAKETRTSLMKTIPLTMKIGAFIQRVTRNRRENITPAYWTYKGSFTTPREYKCIINI